MYFKIEKVIMKSYFQWLTTMRKIPNFWQWRPFCFCSNIKMKQNNILLVIRLIMCPLGIKFVKKRGSVIKAGKIATGMKSPGKSETFHLATIFVAYLVMWCIS